MFSFTEVAIAAATLAILFLSTCVVFLASDHQTQILALNEKKKELKKKWKTENAQIGAEMITLNTTAEKWRKEDQRSAGLGCLCFFLFLIMGAMAFVFAAL